MNLNIPRNQKIWNDKCDKAFPESWETDIENENIFSSQIFFYDSDSDYYLPGTLYCLKNKSNNFYRTCLNVQLPAFPEILHVFPEKFEINKNETTYKERYKNIIDFFVAQGYCDSDIKKKDLLELFNNVFPGTDIEKDEIVLPFHQRYIELLKYFNIYDIHQEIDWNNVDVETEKILEEELRSKMEEERYPFNNKDIKLTLQERFRYQLPLLGLADSKHLTKEQIENKLKLIDLNFGDTINIRFDFKNELSREQYEEDIDYAERVFSETYDAGKYSFACSKNNFLNKELKDYFNVFNVKDTRFVSAPTSEGFKAINFLNDNPKIINLIKDENKKYFIEESKILLSVILAGLHQSLPKAYVSNCLDENFKYSFNINDKGLIETFDIDSCEVFPETVKNVNGEEIRQRKNFKSDVQNIAKVFFELKEKIFEVKENESFGRVSMGNRIFELLNGEEKMLGKDSKPRDLTDLEKAVLACYIHKNVELNKEYNKDFVYNKSKKNYVPKFENLKIYEIPSLFETLSFYVDRRIRKSYESWIRNNQKNLSVEKVAKIQAAKKNATLSDKVIDDLLYMLEHRDDSIFGAFVEDIPLSRLDVKDEQEIVTDTNDPSRLAEPKENSNETIVDLGVKKDKDKENDKSKEKTPTENEKTDAVLNNAKISGVKESDKKDTVKENTVSTQKPANAPITVGKWLNEGHRPSPKKNNPKYVGFGSQKEYFEKEYIKAYSSGDQERVGKCRKCIIQCFKFYGKPFDVNNSSQYFANLVKDVEPGKIKKQPSNKKEIKPEEKNTKKEEELTFTNLAKQILDNYIEIFKDDKRLETKYPSLQKLSSMYKMCTGRSIERDVNLYLKDGPSGRSDD